MVCVTRRTAFSAHPANCCLFSTLFTCSFIRPLGGTLMITFMLYMLEQKWFGFEEQNGACWIEGELADASVIRSLEPLSPVARDFLLGGQIPGVGRNAENKPDVSI
ncbi:UNVERIFIED_CONTAM: hypothetical protein K2H54_047399 [Gekko kuhli]